MAIIGSAYVEIRALDTNLQRDIDKAMKKVKEPLITLQSNVNLTPVREKIRVLREELKRNPLKFSAEVDLDRVHEHIDETYELYKANPLQMETQVNHAPAEAALQSLQERYGEMTSTINTNADTAAAQAQIAAAARPRRSTIHIGAKIDPEYQKALKGLFYTVTGALPADKIKAAFVGLAANLEMSAIAAGKLLTVIGSVGAAGASLGADLFALGGDLSDLIGIAALGPAVFAGLGAGITATVLGWKGFGEALSSDPKKAAKALALLPPEAQEAAKSLKGLGGEIRKTTQTAYWKQMGDSIQQLHKDFFPKLKAGLEGTGSAMGKWGHEFVQALEVAGADGTLENIFKHINKGLDNASKGVQPFLRGLFHLTSAGSDYLDAMGLKLEDWGKRFDKWVQKVTTNGDFDRWIREAKRSFEDLGKTFGASIDIFQGLTRAANASGAKGLHEFAAGMENIAKTVNSEPFQSKLILILKGARRGAEALGEGFGVITKLIGNSSVAISGFLHAAGEVGGQVFKSIATIFDGTGVGSGTIIALAGLKDALAEMEPGFRDLGKVIGDIGEIAGTLFKEMAPGFNNLMKTLQGVVAGLKDGIIAAMPVFNDFVQNFLQLIGPIVVGIAEGIGTLLKGFSELPGALQNVIMVFAALFLLRGKLATFFQSMGYRLDRWRGNVDTALRQSQGFRAQFADNFRYAGASVGYAGSAIARSLGSVRDSFRLTGMAIGDGVKKTFGPLAASTSAGIKTAGAGIKAGFKEAFAFPQEVKDGFSRVGQNISAPFQKAGTAIKGEMQMVGRHTKAYFQQLPDQAKSAWKNLPQTAKENFTGVKNTVGYYMGEAADKVRDRSIYASKHLEDAGKGIKTAVNDVKAGSKAMGDHMRAMVSPVESAATRGAQAVAKGYNGMVLAGTIAGTTLANRLKPTFSAIGDAAGKMFAPVAAGATAAANAAGRAWAPIATGAQAAFSKASAAASTSASAISTAAGRAKQATITGYNNMVLASTVAGTAMGRNAADAAGRISTHAANISSSMGRAFTAVGTFSTNAAKTVGGAFSSAAGTVTRNFAPAGAAIRETFTNIGSNMRPAVTAMGELATAAGKAAGSVGQAAGRGLKGAASGLMGLMGGPWGAALAGASLAVGAFAEAQANAQKKVDDLAASLDQQTGAMTGASKKLLAKDWLDIDASAWDDLWRSGRRNMEELVRDTGVNAAKVTEILSDPAGRDAYVDNWRRIRDAAGDGSEVTEQMANTVHMTKAQMESLSDTDLNEMVRQFENAAETAKKAEAQVQGVAKATGTTTAQAAILSKNYETLASKTSGVDEKFRALRENLDILNKGKMTAVEQEKSHAQNLINTKAALDEVIAANGGAVTNLYALGKGFDFTKQAGIDLHTALSTQADDVIRLGTEALQKALDSGKGLEDAQKIAVSAMAPGLAGMRKTLEDLNLSTPVINEILKGFGLMPDQVTTALNVAGGDKARQEIFLTELAANSFANGNYLGTLKALPDAAVQAIATATGQADAYARGDYEAIIKAANQSPIGIEGFLATVLPVVDGKYEAALKAKNMTKADVDAANLTMAGLKAPTPPSLTAKNAVQPPVSAGMKALAAFSQAPASATITAKDSASPVVDKIQAKITGIKGASPEIKITDNATKKVDYIQGHISALKGKTPVVDIADRATGVLRSIQGWLDGFRDRTVTVTTVRREVDGGKAANGGIVRSMASMFSGSFGLAKAKAYANGGVEKHVAQISAPQAPYRIWSEPETGGEAYIPLAKAKRARSVKILEEVARMFGMTLLKTKAYANGGVEGGSSSSVGSSSSLSGGKVSAAFVSTVAQEMMKDNRSLNDIGLFVVDGIIGGVNAKQGKAVETMTNMAGSLEDAVRTRLEIHSPSKTFLGLGKYIIDGLTTSLKSGAGSVHKQISTLANRIYVAASDIKKATGKSIGSSMSLLNHQKSLNSAWKKVAPAKYADQIVDYYQKTGKTGNRTLADIVRAREDVNYRLKVATDKLKTLQTARADVFKSVSNQIRNEYKLGTNIIGQDKPYIPKMKFSDVMNYTSGMASRLRTFNGKIAALRKKGVAAGLIQEVAMLGSVEGMSVADAILQGSSAQVKSLNTQYGQVGAAASAIGNTTADAMYKVGIDAQAGLVKGLQKDSASLTSAANKLTSQLIRQVKKNLGIRSPSRVMAELGRYTGQGFIMGLDQMQGNLDKRVDSFINLDPRQMNTTATTGVTSSKVAAGPNKEINVHVHPTQGMDEIAVGQAAVRELGWQLLSQ
ncbi:tape measure protein [Arthrobacter phage Atuin]|nr:tape measure protein [Arthrobacter phage Atuin]